MRLTLVAGARPNFLKIAPLIREVERVKKEGADISYRLVHTGQHYDDNLSKVFFTELGLPQPHTNLEAGSGSQAVQTANIMIGFEQELMNNPCDAVIVVGDVNSTMACSIVAKKMQVKVAHVEAGIRSFDMSMPEEINRIVTDAIADIYFTPTETANKNLRDKGVKEKQIYFVGNIMIDSLLQNIPHFTEPVFLRERNINISNSVVLTLHRPDNVDDPARLKQILNTVIEHTGDHNIIFPVHPRTKKALDVINIHSEKLIEIEPQSYLSFNYLVKNCKVVITDSGGIQEETTVLGVPCITLRKNTERPETVTIGTNELVGDNTGQLAAAINVVFSGQWKKGAIPELWDGNTAPRIIKILLEISQSALY